jgi:hypothetical protein
MHARAVGLFLAACALTAIAGVPLATSAGAAAPRSAQVIPAKDLGDQVVRVTWQNFRPTRADGTFTVGIFQCIAHPTSVLRDCNTAETFPLSLTGNQAQANTKKDGTGSAFIDVETTARLPALACSETRPCSLLLYENTIDGFDPNGLPAERALAPLNFRKSSGDCPPVTHFDLQLEAEPSAAIAFYQWAADVCSGQGAFTLDVTNTSSNAARQQFFAGNVDIGVSSLPPQPAELPPNPRAYTATPVDLTGIVVAYNIVDPVTQQQITDVTLTPRLLARLVSDTDILTFFADPEFKKLNPHHHFPLTVADPGVRAEANADTWIVTNWLEHDTNARSFLNGHDRYGIQVNPAWRGVKYPTDVFEARNPNGVYLPRTGEENVGQRLFHATKPADGVASNPSDVGFFGLLDLPTARRFDLPTAALTSGVGKPRVSATRESIQAAYLDMTPTAKGFYVVPDALTDSEAYPLTKVDHALTPDVVDNALTKARIKYLLAYAQGPGQATLAPGFVPFPSPEVAPGTTTTTSTSTTTTTIAASTTVPFSSVGSQTSSYSSGSASGTVSLSPPAAGGPSKNGSRTTEASAVVSPKLALISQNDGLALPVAIGLGLLALLSLLVDLGIRRGPAFVGSARRRFAALRARSANAASTGVAT